MTLLGNGPEWTALNPVLNLVVATVQMYSVKRWDASLASHQNVRNAESLFVIIPSETPTSRWDIRGFVLRLRTQIKWGGILLILGSTPDVAGLREYSLIATDLRDPYPAHALICRPFELAAFVNLFFKLRAWQPEALAAFNRNYDAASKFRELRALSRRLSSQRIKQDTIESLKQIAAGILACKPLSDLLRAPGHGPDEREILSSFLAATGKQKAGSISAAAVRAATVKSVLRTYFDRLNRTVFSDP